MTGGELLQVVGGVLELGGLATVMLGINETRRKFTNRPPLIERLSGPARWLHRRIMRRGKTVDLSASIGTAVSIETAGRIRVAQGWNNLTPDEIMRRLMETVDRHRDMLDNLTETLNSEIAERREADETERRARNRLSQELNNRIAETAAGGLTLEAWGATFFGLGILSTTIGVMVG